jgi:hypothetical protein
MSSNVCVRYHVLMPISVTECEEELRGRGAHFGQRLNVERVVAPGQDVVERQVQQRSPHLEELDELLTFNE